MSFPTAYQSFIYSRTYSRFRDEDKRRETWDETLARYRQFFLEKIPKEPKSLEFFDAMASVKSLDIMPSMRSLWAAGAALERENIAGYNCSYTVIDSIKAIAEVLYILLNGTGVGFSVERQYICKLPEVPTMHKVDKTITFEDSKLGWAEGYYEFLKGLYRGEECNLNYLLLRPKGARLKTFGGRASGHEPLKQLCEFTRDTLRKAQGRRLNSLECYDLVCFLGNCVVVGGVRRSATISLSNFSDMRMRHAKDGQFWLENPQRALSNNSVAYTEKPDMIGFMEEWLSLARSGSGERGIVNREGFKKSAEKCGREVREFGVNPCGEIVLRPKQFCNLTEVVVRATDDLATLKRKVRHAVILGCVQSTLSNFAFLDDEWRTNTEEERLLGVSLTGLADHRVTNGSYGKDALVKTLKELKEVANETAKEWSEYLGINCPTAITCVKPSGTVSQLCDSSSGLHPRYSAYYIRRVRVTSSDPMADYLCSRGVKWSSEVGELKESCNTKVFEFPIASPEGSLKVSDVNALEQLEYWLTLKTHWCDHNPSATIYVKDEEWLAVGAWVYKNWDDIGGLSFLPVTGSHYELPPYEEISQQAYELLSGGFPQLNFEDLSKFEHGVDTTIGAQTMACMGNSCELA